LLKCKLSSTILTNEEFKKREVMPLTQALNKITESLHTLYNAIPNKQILGLCNNFQIPIFATLDDKIVYTNDKFLELFPGTEIYNKLLSKKHIAYGSYYYNKETIYSKENFKIFQLIKDNLFNVPNNIVPHALINKDTKILVSNEPLIDFLEITNLSDPNYLSDFVSDSSKELILNHLTKAKKNYPLEIKINNQDNSTALMYPVKIEDEDLYHCYFLNITEYKNIEMHLIHSQKMQAIGQLSGGIAHDFNNLLTAMLGFCDLLLLKHPAGDPSFAEIMQIKQNSNRAANLVRQLLALSRKQVLKPKILDLTDIIAELSHLIRRLIGCDIKLNIIHARDLYQVKVDQGQIEQVIINLVVNAKDAIVASGKAGTITISTKNVTIKHNEKIHRDLISPTPNDKMPAGQYILLEVSDTGTGISKKIKDKIFEPFFSTKSIGAGTGLGLSTVYGIINQMGGHIYIHSQEGVGSKFFIYLKAFINQDNQEAESMQASETQLKQQDLTGNATILLVEDEAPVRMFTTHALSNKGYRVLEASNGDEALSLMKSEGHNIDIIITDVIMPGINGPSLISTIHKTHPKVKVIFISGYAEEAFSDTYGIERSEDFNFLSKPFTLQQLATKVKDVLGTKVKL